MESTLEPRELPVLDAVVRYFDEHPQGQGVMLTCRQVADLAGRDPTDVYLALKILEPTYVRLEEGLARGPTRSSVRGITDEARRRQSPAASWARGCMGESSSGPSVSSDGNGPPRCWPRWPRYLTIWRFSGSSVISVGPVVRVRADRGTARRR